MSLIIKDEGSSFELVPRGLKKAVCIGVFDLGIQPSMNPQYPPKRQVLMRWELDIKMEQGSNQGKPFCMSKFYTYNLHEKSNLSKDLESWLGKVFTKEERESGFDAEQMMGKSCYMNITHDEKDGKPRAKIAAITELPSRVEELSPVEMLDPKNPPEWIKKIQAKQLQKSILSPDEVNEILDSELPF